jgi:hypothetical protein
VTGDCKGIRLSQQISGRASPVDNPVGQPWRHSSTSCRLQRPERRDGVAYLPEQPT